MGAHGMEQGELTFPTVSAGILVMMLLGLLQTGCVEQTRDGWKVEEGE